MPPTPAVVKNVRRIYALSVTMRATKLTSAALLYLAGPVAADWWDISISCTSRGTCFTKGEWYTSSRKWKVSSFDKGCHTPYITFVSKFCADWDAKRGHYITDSNERRCVKENWSTDLGWDKVGFHQWQAHWEETPCTW